MKKIIFSLISTCIILVSCHKEHSNPKPSDTGMYNVKFNVGFSSKLTNFDLAKLKVNSAIPDTSLTNHIALLFYVIYDASGKQVQSITKTNTDSSFGSFTTSLLKGSYTLVVVGGSGGLLVEPLYKGVDISQVYVDLNPNPADMYYPNFNVDAFYKKISLTVGSSNSTQNIALDRIASRLIININDAIPSVATYIKATIVGAADQFYVATGKAIASNNPVPGTFILTHTLTGTDAGKTNFQFSTLFLYGSPMTVTLVCSAAEPPDLGTIYGAKTINNITGEANQITILSGNLFGGTGGSGVHVVADTTWNTSSTIHF